MGDGEDLTPKDYGTLIVQGFQELISVNLTEIEFVGGKGKNPILTMTLNAVAEIANLEHYGEKVTRSYRYVGPQAYFSEWIAKDANELKKDFDLGVQSLIDNIYHDLFVALIYRYLLEKMISQVQVYLVAVGSALKIHL